MIHPHLTYGILAWGKAGQSVIKKTLLLQKRAIRTINRSYYKAHTEPLFKKMNILKLEDQYTLEVLIFMFKYMHNQLPISFNNIFKLNRDVQANYQTRQSSLLAIKRCDSKHLKTMPIYSFPPIWNEWTHSNDLNNITHDISIYKFKKIIKKKLINNYAERVRCFNPVCRQCTTPIPL